MTAVYIRREGFDTSGPESSRGEKGQKTRFEQKFQLPTFSNRTSQGGYCEGVQRWRPPGGGEEESGEGAPLAGPATTSSLNAEIRGLFERAQGHLPSYTFDKLEGVASLGYFRLTVIAG